MALLIVKVTAPCSRGVDKGPVRITTGFKCLLDAFLFLLFPFCPSGFILSPSLCSSGWWESNNKCWSVFGGFLCISSLRPLSSSVSTAQSKKGRLPPLTSYCVNLMFLSTALMSSVKVSASVVFLYTKVSSIKRTGTYLTAWPTFSITAVKNPLLIWTETTNENMTSCLYNWALMCPLRCPMYTK